MFKKSDEAKHEQIKKKYAQSKTHFPEVPDISAQELNVRMEDENLVIVDVRTPEEQAISKIKGAITADEFEAKADQYRDKSIVCYCTIGHRSGLYTQQLMSRGFKAENLQGAILAWTHASGKLEDSSGETTKVHIFSKAYSLTAEGYDPVW
ncbi:MAG: rhodanese-like domain-containing protein [Planctomycetota bacterium]|nr:rhodanese-like domain-containing protein [Planctomycetota bacterium]